MKLRTLRLHGFKSFADRTEVRFHDGITAIVGPNGCGKSNISDAIRWVLGEQRPTAIRGARMEEAIFQGTVTRRPVNRGSVALGVSNEDGVLPVPFEEVEIARTVYRDGGSEYFLNRSPCRLRDIQELCRDTGLGANAYAIIESRMIDAILSDRAEERRALFEEAAGIGKYKDRRKGALRRLERAELDLERLDDVVSEVQSKVRSLARQKGRAERFAELRARRLALDLALTLQERSLVEARLKEIRAGLEGGRQDGEGLRAEVTRLEAELELLHRRRVEAEEARTAAATSLEAVRREMARWEQELAVATERDGAAERRLQRLAAEREDLTRSAAALDEEERSLEARRGQLESEAAAARQGLEAARALATEARARLQEARIAADRVETRERELARRGAELEGEAASLDAQAAELGRRLEVLVRELAEAGSTLSELDSQGDLFAGRVEALEEEERDAVARVGEAVAVLEAARHRLEGARRTEMEALDRAAALEAQRSVLEGMERDREGVEPVVREALALGAAGVLGPLGDFLFVAPDRAPAVEAFLGPLLRGLVVEDSAAAVGLGRWFREAWGGGGGLLVLPLDRVPAPRGPLPPGVKGSGAGAPWVWALLGGASWVEEEDELLAGADGGVMRLTPNGACLDPNGVLRFGNPLGGTGLLERRGRLERLAEEAAAARAEAEAATAAREEAGRLLQEAEAGVDAVRGGLREVEDRRREVKAQVESRIEQRHRADRLREELARQEEGTRAARLRAEERAAAARREAEALRSQEEALSEARRSARAALDRAQEAWEVARAEESRRELEAARLEGELGRANERARDLTAQQARGKERLGVLELEEEELLRTRVASAGLRAEGEEALADLFRRRAEGEGAMSRRDEALQEVQEALAAAELQLRRAREAERASIDLRHRLELEERELAGALERSRERLEVEWGRDLEALMEEVQPAEGEPAELRAELGRVSAELAALGPVNMLAVEEHQEESARLEFLSTQRDDLLRARDDLRAAIREINQTATARFNETFERIRENFRETFHRLFQGGECDLWLADPEDPLESAIEIHASPVGKRTQRIDLLSGGERALTALALLFGIYLVKPSPFCVLDEVDAPLDENNIGRFIRLLQEFKGGSQFVVITHNPRTIEAADWIYGVTMEEPGVSTIVGVKLDEALQAAGITPAGAVGG